MGRRLVLVCGLSFDDHRDNAILIAGDVHIALFVFADATHWHGNLQKQSALPPILGILSRSAGAGECLPFRTIQSPDAPAAEIGVEEYTLHYEASWFHDRLHRPQLRTPANGHIRPPAA